MMMRTQRRWRLLVFGTVWLALSALIPVRPAAAVPSTSCDPASSDNFVCESVYGESPPDGTGNVGTAVHVVMHKSFTEAPDPDQCVVAFE
jgi:hypothetical protein